MSQARTTVHLVRHGEVDNPHHVLYERLAGFHLSDRGRAMARRVADFFNDGHHGQIDRLVVSPLERAQETAAPLAQGLGLAIETDQRLIEAQSHFAGMRIDLPNLIRPRSLRRLFNPLRPSWGEPYEAIADRMTQAITDLRTANPGRQMIVVSHQSPIWRARLKAEGRPVRILPRGQACSLASVTSLIYEDDQLSAVWYSEPARDLLPPPPRHQPIL
ncbi:MAG: histidine phosphatase family protein [Bifidobacteriaceae bacterium]|jgi:broad specificity phosphatase PhoE|nr:histidine phosphatase family protein [Bifidobacteriaceae bacterium]